MADQPMNVRAALLALARRWVLVLAAVTVGTAAGLGYAMVREPVYVARATVLLPPAGADSRGNPLRDIGTVAQVARGREVLEEAGRAFTPPVPATRLRDRIGVDGLTDNVIVVRASAGTAANAALLADAVANAFVAVTGRTAADVASAATESLREQAAVFEGRLQQLNGDIAANVARLAGMRTDTAEAIRIANVVSGLRADAAAVARQLADVNARIADTNLKADLERQGTRVVQPAAAPSRPDSPQPVLNALVGALAGLVGGLIVAGVLELAARRARRRDDIALAVAAPVLASVPLAGADPNPVEAQALRYAVRRLGVEEGRSAHLVFVLLAGDIAASQLVSRLATAAGFAARGQVTVERDYRDLGTGSGPPGPRGSGPSPQVTVNVVVADGPFPVLPHVNGHGAPLTALVVSSGFAGLEELGGLASACRDAGHPILGVFVANPDPSDFTTGLPAFREAAPVRAPAPERAASPVVIAAPTRDDEDDVDLERGPSVHVPALVRALRRRWRVWLATGAAGVAGALALSTVFAPAYTGTATVLIGHPAGSDPARNVATDLELARTLAVAERAAAALGGGVRGEELLATVRPAALSVSLIRIRVGGPTAEDAARRAEAVATAFVEFRREQVAGQWKAAEKSLTDRREAVVSELASVDERQRVLGGADPAVSPNLAGMAELHARQLTLSNQLASLNQQLEAGGLDAEANVARTAVVDGGRSLGRPVVAATAFNVAAGLVLGLGAGIGWVVVAEMTSERVRRRGDVSAALGVPVPVSVRRDGLARAARHLGEVVEAGRDRRLAVVAADRVDLAARLVAALADDLVQRGRPVLLRDLSPEGALARAVGAPSRRGRAAPGQASETAVLLTAGGVRAGDARGLRGEADTEVALVVLDPSVGADHLAAVAHVAVAVVSAGEPTRTWLRSIAALLRGAGIVLDSAVLIGADPRDESVGMVRRRAAAAPKPAARARR